MQFVKKVRIIYLVSSLFALAIGMCIYLLFRDLKDMLLFKWIHLNNFNSIEYIQLVPSITTNILIYNIPDMLWFLSGILFLRFIWFNRDKEQKIYLILFYIIGALFELSQLSKIIPGTFDFLDLIFMGIAAFGEGLLYKICIKRRIE